MGLAVSRWCGRPPFCWHTVDPLVRGGFHRHIAETPNAGWDRDAALSRNCPYGPVVLPTPLRPSARSSGAGRSRHKLGRSLPTDEACRQSVVCHGLLAACRRYADASCEEYTFLAGLSADQRSTSRSKKTEIANRRRRVGALRVLGAPTLVIAEIVGRDPSLIRGDIRTLEQRDRLAM